MRITAEAAAALAILTEALDEPDIKIARTLHHLTLDAAAAVPSYLGLSVVVSQSDSSCTVTVLVEGAVVGDIRTSLHMLLPSARAGREAAPVTLIIYAGTPGTFVDVAADLTWLTCRPLTDVTLDEHLTTPAGPDTAVQLQAACDINQAIGVLIGRGYTPQQADRQLDVRAAGNRTDRHCAAQLILDKVSTADGDRDFDIH
ncbi:MAG: hypothetical protein QOH57_754 [Mycobacterium sp.]|nr:hypothetical protein [Mycobacterium sp.]